jgi:DNA-binding FadR family transcriptional regulator
MATDAQRAEIARLCDALMIVVDRGDNYIAADAAFHGAISDATGNPMFGQILTRLNDALERSQESPFSRSGFGLRSFPHHRTLSDAISRGDADSAGAAITAIIDSVEDEIRQIIAPTGATI